MRNATAISTPWQTVSPHTSDLGESPFWHPHEQMLYWVDSTGRQLLRADVATGAIEAWDMPSEPGCIAPAASGGLVIALRDAVFRARQWGGLLTRIVTLDYDPAQMRANDGKCDALGRFWFGTLDETRVNGNAALYCLDCRAGKPVLERKTDPATLPATTGNGLAWSPDNRTLYWADTASHRVHAWDFDVGNGAMAAPRVFLQFDAKPTDWQFDPHTLTDVAAGYAGRPDGAAVDVQGNYYIAMYEGRRLCKFSPAGELRASWAIPAQCPTMPCFGGADLQTLYLTSARQKRSAAELAALPLSGCVFFMRVDVPGLALNFFAD
jgi:sugar lactone lactonase YvrE